MVSVHSFWHKQSVLHHVLSSCAQPPSKELGPQQAWIWVSKTTAVKSRQSQEDAERLLSLLKGAPPLSAPLEAGEKMAKMDMAF